MTQLKRGDKVVMHDCYEQKFYRYLIWTCTSEQFENGCGEKLIHLESNGRPLEAFDVDCLRKVSEQEAEEIRQNAPDEPVVEEKEVKYHVSVYKCPKCGKKLQTRAGFDKPLDYHLCCSCGYRY